MLQSRFIHKYNSIKCNIQILWQQLSKRITIKGTSMFIYVLVFYYCVYVYWLLCSMYDEQVNNVSTIKEIPLCLTARVFTRLFWFLGFLSIWLHWVHNSLTHYDVIAIIFPCFLSTDFTTRYIRKNGFSPCRNGVQTNRRLI